MMSDPKNLNKPRVPGTTLSLENMLRSFITHPMPVPTSSEDGPSYAAPVAIPRVMMHNAGNDAFMCLFALQMLLDPAGTAAPTIKKTRVGRPSSGTPMGPNGNGHMIPGPIADIPARFSGFAMVIPSPTARIVTPPRSPYDLSAEFGQMQVERTRSRSHSPAPHISVASPSMRGKQIAPGRRGWGTK